MTTYLAALEPAPEGDVPNCPYCPGQPLFPVQGWWWCRRHCDYVAPGATDDPPSWLVDEMAEARKVLAHEAARRATL